MQKYLTNRDYFTAVAVFSSLLLYVFCKLFHFHTYYVTFLTRFRLISSRCWMHC